MEESDFRRYVHAIAMEWQGSWDDHLDLIKLSFKHSNQATIQMAPFKALYGRRCHGLVYWDDLIAAATLGPNFLLQMTDQVKVVRERMKA